MHVAFDCFNLEAFFPCSSEPWKSDVNFSLISPRDLEILVLTKGQQNIRNIHIQNLSALRLSVKI